MRIRSKLGKGTMVVVRLPRAASQPVHAERSDAAA
jgi:hypothetical protein